MANMNRADMINSLALAMGVNAPGSVINNNDYTIYILWASRFAYICIKQWCFNIL